MRLQCLRILCVCLVSTSLASCGGSSQEAPQAVQHAQAAHRSQKTASAAGGYEAAVQSLYIAYFGRPADPTGLTNFEDALLNAGAPTDIGKLEAAYSTNATVRALVDSFGTSAESQALYQGGDTTAFVTAVYQNVLGRAPDSSGLAYWTNAISNKTLTQGNAALSILAGALSNTTTQGLQDGQLVNKRIAVAQEFTSGLAQPYDLSVYSGATAAAAARTMLAGVSANTSPTAYAYTVDAQIMSLQGSTYSGSSVLYGDASDGLYMPGLVTGSFTQGQPQALQVAVSAANLSEFTGKNIYVVVAEDASAVFNTGALSLAFYGSNDIVASLMPSYSLAPGLHQGMLTINLCADAQCGTLYPGSPFHLPYSVNVLPAQYTINNLALYLNSAKAFSLQSVQGSGNLASAQGSGVIAGVVGNQVAMQMQHQYPMTFTASVDASWAQVSVNADQVTLTVPGLSTLAAGSYTANLTITSSYGQTAVVPFNLSVTGSQDGTGTAASFTSINALAIDVADDIYVSDVLPSSADFVSQLRVVTPSGVVSTVIDSAGVINGANTLMAQYCPTCSTRNQPFQPLMNVYGVAGRGGVLFFTQYDQKTGPLAEFNMLPSDYEFDVAPLAGPSITGDADGTGGAVALDVNYNAYYTTGGAAIEKRTWPGGASTLFAGALNATGVPGAGGTMFGVFGGLAVDTSGNVYATDLGKHAIWKITPAGAATVFAGGGTASASGNVNGAGTSARFSRPTGIAIDGSGGVNGSGNLVDPSANVYVTDSDAHNVRKISLDGSVTTVAGPTSGVGAGNAGFADGTGAAARFNGPWSIVVDSTGNLFVSDRGNSGDVIRKITSAGVVTTFAGGGGGAAAASSAIQVGISHAAARQVRRSEKK